MPRKLRSSEYSEIDIYHVCARGNNQKTIFFDDDDRSYMEYLLFDITKKFKCKIHSYCLMDNHIHLMFEAKHDRKSKIMQQLLQRYSQAFNHKYKKIGHLFQQRHLAKAINSSKYIKVLTAYIHLNPVRAKMVKYPIDYKWSSYNVFINKRQAKWLTKNFVLSFFKNKKEFIKYMNSFCNIYSKGFKEIIFDKKLVHSHESISTLFNKIRSNLDFLKIEDNKLYEKLFIKISCDKFGVPINNLANYFSIHRSTVSKISRKEITVKQDILIEQVFNEILNN